MRGSLLRALLEPPGCAGGGERLSWDLGVASTQVLVQDMDPGMLGWRDIYCSCFQTRLLRVRIQEDFPGGAQAEKVVKESVSSSFSFHMVCQGVCLESA